MRYSRSFVDDDAQFLRYGSVTKTRGVVVVVVAVAVAASSLFWL